MKPEFKIMAGTICLNAWNNGNYHSFKIDKSYKDENGEWKHTDNFNERDLLSIAEICREGFRKVKMKEVRDV